MIVMIVLKNSITKVEATVVQPMHIAVTDKRAVIVCRGLFLLLFWTSKKVSLKKYRISMPTNIKPILGLLSNYLILSFLVI